MHVRLEQCFRELADQEGRPYSEAEKDANPIFVRQVLATDKVGEGGGPSVVCGARIF